MSAQPNRDAVDNTAPRLPKDLSWEELQRLPADIAAQVELWDRRVVWKLRGPFEHQQYTGMIWSALRREAAHSRQLPNDDCWEVGMETTVFLDPHNRSDFLTPDFLVFQCLASEYQDIYANNVLLVGEVLSPSNTSADIEAKKNRYADHGIPWYWEVRLTRNPRAIASIRVYGLENGRASLPEGVVSLRTSNYVLAGEWLPRESDGIEFEQPFPIRIPWSELEF